MNPTTNLLNHKSRFDTNQTSQIVGAFYAPFWHVQFGTGYVVISAPACCGPVIIADLDRPFIRSRSKRCMECTLPGYLAASFVIPVVHRLTLHSNRVGWGDEGTPT